MSHARRLGILGGTFDPIHVGHLDAADAARAALSLDEILLVPALDPPHRPIDPRATMYQRFALVSLAAADRPAYRVSDMELLRQGPSYTADTLRSLHAQGWRALQLFFILGTDAFAEIATWHDFPSILDLAHFIVIARPGTTIDMAVARTPELRARMCMGEARGDGLPRNTAIDGRSTRIFLVEADTRGVSSTQVRERLAAAQPIDDLVPAAVARHILKHHLYGAVDDLHGEDERSRN
jgi:nicotinate-nucleotide adenylyltransferase